MAAKGQLWSALLVLCGLLACSALAEDITLWRDSPTGPLPVDEAGQRISAVYPDRISLTVDLAHLDALRQAGWRLTVETEPARAVSGYPTYAQVQTMLQGWVASHPDRCRLFSIGQSVGTPKRDLWVLRITDNPDGDEPEEPRLKLIGSMHGDEKSAGAMLLTLIDYMLTVDGVDPFVTQLLDDTDFYVMPIMNPDGWEAHRRENNHAIDLNRNFPSPFASVTVQPETQAVIDWSLARQFHAAISLHSGAIGVAYPWGHNHSYTSPSAQFPETRLIRDMSLGFTFSNPYMREINGGEGWVRGTINGTDWYAVNNEMADWSYRYGNCLETTIEFSSSSKSPTIADLNDFAATWLHSANGYRDNRLALQWYLARAQNAVRGQIVDAESGLPVPGTVGIRTPGGSELYDAWLLLPPLLPGWNPVSLARQPLAPDFNFGAGTVAWQYDPYRKAFTVASDLQAGVGYFVASTVAIPAQLVPAATTLPAWQADTRWQLRTAGTDFFPGVLQVFVPRRDRSPQHRAAPDELVPAGRTIWVRAPANDTAAPVLSDWPRADNLPNAFATDTAATGWFHRIIGNGMTPLWVNAAAGASLNHTPPLSPVAGQWQLDAAFVPPLRPALVLTADGAPLQSHRMPLPRQVDIPLSPVATNLRVVWQVEGGSLQVLPMAVAGRSAAAQIPVAADPIQYYIELRRDSDGVVLKRLPVSGFTTLGGAR